MAEAAQQSLQEGLGVTLRRMTRSRMARLGLAGWMLGLPALLAVAPATLAANPVTLTTPYPAIEVAPGAKVSLKVQVSTQDAGRVNLSLDGVPSDWTATLRGGGFLITGVQTDGTEATEVTLDLSVPEGASGSHRIELNAESDGSTATLPVDVRVTPNAAGSVELTTQVKELKGSTDASFKFNLTLRNDTPDDLPFGVTASGPAGWTVDAKITSQAQAASVIVAAGSTTAVEVDVTVPEDADAGVYPITVDATSGDKTAHQDLSVEVIGSYKLSLTTPDGRLSANASAGSQTDLSVTVQNDGSADVPDVKLSATSPTGWEVTFDPATVTVPAGGSVQATAHLTPSGNAIAGDYVVTMRADSDLDNATAEMRITIETSLLWGIVGVGLIALVLAGLWYTFRRYGRR
jgi:uncharacterized membrane protein